MYKIREDVDLKELEKFGFEEQFWGYIYYPNNNNPNTRYFSAIRIDNDNSALGLCRILCFKLENMSMWCNDLEQLELDIENIKNSYIAFKQKAKELIKAGLVVKVEE